MYQALYRKWRPRTFDDVVGQEHITQTLKRQVAAGRTSHAYLFTGTRGTGKTSCAKILARAVNCERPGDGNPCNGCPSCRGIENASILDVVELDAASNNRVDDVRAILDEAVYTPASVKKRVYIVDEVHMLSGQAFNALLQTLEEPPEHLMFILATTEIHKVPATIKSRCQQFSFKRIRPEAIAGRLDYVAGQEGLELSPEGAALLARLADGGMRDALSLLDRCAGERRVVGEREILETLGLAGNTEAAALMECAANGDTEGALTRLDRLYAGGKEMSALLGELSGLARDLLIRRAAPKNGAALMTGGFDAAALDRLGSMLDTPRLLRMASALQQTAAGLARSPNRRIDTELCLVSLCDPRMDDSPAGLAARLAALEEQAARGGIPSERGGVTAGRPGIPQQTYQGDVGAHIVRPAPSERGANNAGAQCAPLQAPTERPPVPEDAPPPFDDGDAPPLPEDAPPWEEETPSHRPTGENLPPPPYGRRSPSLEKGGLEDPHGGQMKRKPPLKGGVAERSEAGGVPTAPVRSVPAAVSWPALRARLEQVMGIADFCFVGNPDMVTGTVEGRTVTLWATSDFVKGFIDKPDILKVVADAAGKLAGGECRAQVRVGTPPAVPVSGDPLDALMGLENVSEI